MIPCMPAAGWNWWQGQRLFNNMQDTCLILNSHSTYTILGWEVG